MKISALLPLLVALSTPALAANARQAKSASASPRVVAARASTKAKPATAKPATAKPATAKPATAKLATAKPIALQAKQLSDDARAKIAENKVRTHLKPWVSRDTKVTVRPALVAFNGDARNPITGAGPIEIFVTQKRTYKPGLWNRLRAAFNPFGKQKYLVNVDTNGAAQILERTSLSPQSRFLRFFMNKLPLGAFVHDVFNSGKMTEALVTAVSASGAAFISPAMSGALFMRVAQVVGQGINSQDAVRNTALGATVTWAKDEGKRIGWPTLMDSYRFYQSTIEAQQQGARPLGLGAFANALAVHDL